MLNLLNFEDSLSDNPRYRWQIEEHEAEISDLECCLEKVLKHCTGYVDTGKIFCDSMGPFIESVDELANHFNNDPEIKETFVCFTEHLEEIKGFYSMLLDQTRCTILASVKAMMKRDIKNVKEHKKAFETKSDELDAALRINSTKNNKKKEDNQEAALSALADTKTSFHHTSVDYAYEINKIQMGKRFLITEKFLALMYAYYSFFHQGYASLNDIEPYLKNLNSVMQKTQSEHTDHVQSMGDRHSAVSQLKKNKYDGLMNTPKDDSVSLEGYLFKRSHNTFKTWKRRYFLIKTNQLLYQKRGKSGKDSDRVVSEDLRISHVKQTEEQDRRYCFELIMPTKRLYLQADSEKLRNVWIKSLQSGIEAAIHNTKREEPEQKKNKKSEEYGKESSSSVQRLVVDIKGLPGNEVCADCNNSEPVWASINLGVTLCIDCSGIHRKLGVHISKVRSLELDSWDPEQCSLMLKLGNTLVNAIYEHSVCTPYTKPEPSEISMSKRETWIKAKYEDKQFLANRSCIKIRQHNNLVNYKSSSISNTPRCNSVKVNKKGIRPLTRLFNTTKKKVRGGSDGTREIDFSHSFVFSDDEEESDLGRAISPQYTMIGSDEPDIDPETESCVPDHLLLNKPLLSTSTPDLTDISSKVLDLPNDLQLSGLDNLNNIGLHILNQKLYEASGTGDIPGMFQALVEGADINHNDKNNGRTPLIQSVISGSEAALQLLLSNGASLNVADHEGQSAMYHAAELGNTLQACLLIKRGANHRTKDISGKDALDVALDHTHADIVTMLRYDRLNEDSSHRDDNSQQLLADFSKKFSEDMGNSSR